MGTLITLELELFVACQRNLMGFHFNIVGIQETLDFQGVIEASKAARPAVLALLFATQCVTRTVWTPSWILGLGHMVQT